MDEILRNLQELAHKAEALERQIQAKDKIQDNLESRIKELETTLKEKDIALAELEEKYEAAQLVGNLSLNGDRESIKEKIESYLEEIDLCLKKFGD